MGLEITKAEFDEHEIRRYRRRLQDNLDALYTLLDRPDFGAGPPSLGAELELYLVNQRGRPLGANVEVLEACQDPRLTLEINRFNLEYNLTPVPAAARPFSTMEAEMTGALDKLAAAAATHRGRIVPIGILPTLKRGDFGMHAMTDAHRYRALTTALQHMRGEMFTVRINGRDPISLRANDVTLEGANTSMQLHFRVPPREFARTFNAIQLITPVVLGIAGNSPLLLGHRLWHETRIPLFKHAIDGRNIDSRAVHLPSRVDFGNGWVRHGAYELFAAAVHLHDPILPICSKESAARAMKRGCIPALFELRLHQGTTWPWNRPVFDHHDGGHLRIEMRALPAGPSPCDMIANAAFAIGAAVGLRANIERIIPAMPFHSATYNFYRAAEHGIKSRLLWPSLPGLILRRTSVVDIARSLLPAARKGLAELQVDRAEAAHYLGLIERRLESGETGATWQLRQATRLQKRHTRSLAMRLLLDHYIEQSAANLPVAEWTNA